MDTLSSLPQQISRNDSRMAYNYLKKTSISNLGLQKQIPEMQKFLCIPIHEMHVAWVPKRHTLHAWVLEGFIIMKM